MGQRELKFLMVCLAIQACGQEQIQGPQRRTTNPQVRAPSDQQPPAPNGTPISQTPGSPLPPATPTSPSTSGQTPQITDGIVWKAVLMTGDHSIRAFDNARKSVKGILEKRGIATANIHELSMTRSEQRDGVEPSSLANLEKSLESLNVSAGEGCLVHLTSHGSRTGFYLSSGGEISPEELDEVVEKGCGDHPTVLLVSACYSGIFARDPVTKPNRIVLTAAAADRTSFGCSAEAQYTYWDGCLIDELPKASSWKNLADSVTQCIQRKESGGNFTSSKPQTVIGDQTLAVSMLSAI